MKQLKLPLTILSAAVLVAVVAGFTTLHTTSVAQAVPPSGATALQKAFVDVYKQVSPSVVQIKTSAGLGSGIVFDTKGNIVTNDHVVSGATAFTVTTSTGKNLQGT